MENKLTPELLEKVKLAKSAEELAALAKENGAEITVEKANVYFAQLHKTGELADDELDQVAGGCDDEPDNKDEPEYLYGRQKIGFYDSCEHFINEISKTPGTGTCMACGHSGYLQGTFVCFCPEKFNLDLEWHG